MSPARPSGPAQKWAVAFVLALAAITIVAGARIALVLSATPTEYWLTELYALVQMGVPVDTATLHRAEQLSKYLDDPAFVLTRLPACTEDASNNAGTCLEVIDAGLSAIPTSGELWLARAHMLLAGGYADEEFLAALRESYRYAPREGWIAGQRVVLALGAYQLLPDELKQKAREDLELVLTASTLVQPLVDAYVDNPRFREIAKSAVEQISTEGQASFLYFVTSRTNILPDDPR